MIAATVKVSQRIPKLEREMTAILARGLTTVASDLHPKLIKRITQGISSTGPFRPLGADSKKTPDRGLFWVHPSRPHPPGWVTKPTTGKVAGWAGYDDYEAFLKGSGDKRTFKRTGRLMDSLGILIVNAGRVKLEFKGTHHTTTSGDGKKTNTRNRDIAFYLSRAEPVALLTPTKPEIAHAISIAGDSVQADFETITADGATVSGLDKRSESITRRRPATASRR